jgi:hypothetical protein
MMAHRGKIKYNSIAFILCTTSYYFGTMEADGWHWALPGGVKWVRGTEE